MPRLLNANCSPPAASALAPDFPTLTPGVGYGRPGYLEELPMEDIRGHDGNKLFWRRPCGCEPFLPRFMKAGQGHIVMVSSMAGFFGLFGYTGYCASKFAVLGFSESLHYELAPFGIRVSVLCPPEYSDAGT